MANELEYKLVIDTRKGTVALKRIGETYEKVGKVGAKGIDETRKSATALNRTLGRVQRTAVAFIALMIGREISQQFRRMVSAGIEFNAVIEQSKLGIASIIMSQGKFVDSVGQTLEGYEALVEAQKVSGQIVRQLQVDNLKTIATLDQLVIAFQQGLAPAMERGFDVERAREFTVAMVQAAGALGINLNMMAEELRSLLRGTITPRATFIATALGITNQDIRRYESDTEGLFNFLMGKLESFQAAGIESQKTWRGLTSNVADVIKFALGKGFEPLFEYLKGEMADLQKWVVEFDDATGAWTINPQLLSTFEGIGSAIEGMVKGGKEFLGYVKETGEGVLIIYRAFELLGVLLGGLAEKTLWQPETKEGQKTFGELIGLGKDFGSVLDWLDEKIANLRESFRGVEWAEQEDPWIGFTASAANAVKFLQNIKGLTEDQLKKITALRAELGVVTDLEEERLVPLLQISGLIEAETEARRYLSSLTKEQLGILIKLSKVYEKAEPTTEKALVAQKIQKEILRTMYQQDIAIGKAAASTAALNKEYELQDYFLKEAFEARLRLTDLEKGLPATLREALEILDEQQKAARERNREIEELDISSSIEELRRQYAEATGDIEGQREAIQKLLENEIRRLEIAKQLTPEYEQLLRNMEELNELTREFERAAVTEGMRQELAGLTGDWDAIIESERELIDLEYEHQKALGGLTDEQERLLEMIRSRQQVELEAIRKRDAAVLASIGMSEYYVELNRELISQYKNVWPDAIDMTGDAFANLFTDLAMGTMSAKDAVRSFLEDLSQAFIRLGIEVMLTIAKMKLMEALGYGSETGGRGWAGIIAGIIGAVAGGVAGGGGTLPPTTVVQRGGLFTQPTNAIIGEAGPEAVVPLAGGKIPVEMKKERLREETLNIYLVDDREKMPTMSPEDVVMVVSSDIQSDGITRRTIKRFV